MTKPVRRVTAFEYKVLYPKPRQVVVTLLVADGEDLIQFREKGRRQVYTVLVKDVFATAVRRHAAAVVQARKAARKGGAR